MKSSLLFNTIVSIGAISLFCTINISVITMIIDHGLLPTERFLKGILAGDIVSNTLYPLSSFSDYTSYRDQLISTYRVPETYRRFAGVSGLNVGEVINAFAPSFDPLTILRRVPVIDYRETNVEVFLNVPQTMVTALKDVLWNICEGVKSVFSVVEGVTTSVLANTVISFIYSNLINVIEAHLLTPYVKPIIQIASTVIHSNFIVAQKVSL